MLTASLFGNGVSIAYNHDLSVPTLTTDLLRLFDAAGATEPDRALAAFANSLAAIEGDQFEALLGPLSTTADALGYLPGMAALAQAAGAPAVVDALGIVQGFLGDVHRVGLAITLNHIAERSRGGNYDVVFRTGRELIGLGMARDLTVATLNYDGLLHAGLMDAGVDGWGKTVFPISDLAAGYSAEELEIVPGRQLVGHPMRDVDDLMVHRAHLVQLHGSLGWLRDPADSSKVVKFELGELRDIAYWDAFRAGATAWEPVVVLTDRKERAVAGWPFSFAYDVFQRRLIDAERWLVAGYGLGDVPVNLLFRTAVEQQRRRRAPAAPTLIVGYAKSIDELRNEAHERLGIPMGALLVTNVGLPGVFDTGEWAEWKALG